jgi:hypothetical protein
MGTTVSKELVACIFRVEEFALKMEERGTSEKLLLHGITLQKTIILVLTV